MGLWTPHFSWCIFIFVFFIVLLVFGADKIPSIAKGLAKGMTQIRQATNEIKTEISKNTDMKNPTESVTKDLKDSVSDIKKDFDDNFTKVDAILTPSTPSSAFKIGAVSYTHLTLPTNREV